jgi:sulfite exporter TauE/SafE
MVLTALVMGFAGSLHCIGMCSPLAMAVTNLNPRVALNRLIYNVGRIFTYGILGAIVGTLGWTMPFGNFQNLVSILLGVTLLIFGVLGVSNLRVPGLTNILQHATTYLKKLFGKFLQQKNYSSVLILGSLNGILPCGLTFLALTFCLTLNSPIDSFYYMVLFGLGTLPAMLGFTAILMSFLKRFNVSLRKVTTTMLILSGCLLIARVFLFHHHNLPEEHGMVDIILCR